MQSQFPEGYLFHKEALWLKIDEDNEEALIGVSYYAQQRLGEVLFVDVPAVGATLDADTPFGAIESHKVVSDLVAPASGIVVARNETLSANPGLVNKSCYEDGWLLRIKVPSSFDPASLLSSAAFRDRVGS